MRNPALLALSLTFGVVGCTSNDKTGAGLEGSLNAPPAPAVSSDSRTQPAGQPDPKANGGFNLPASAPYQGSATATQNVNPAPFLAASQSQGAVAASQNKAGTASPKKAARRKLAER
jgi:hypothetical protein